MGAEYKSEIGSTKDTHYLALTGELWRFFARMLDKIDRIITAPHCICHEKNNNDVDGLVQDW